MSPPYLGSLDFSVDNLGNGFLIILTASCLPLQIQI